MYISLKDWGLIKDEPFEGLAAEDPDSEQAIRRALGQAALSEDEMAARQRRDEAGMRNASPLLDKDKAEAR